MPYKFNPLSGDLDYYASSTGANTTLSNLTSPTAVNQSLIPGTSGIGLGQSGVNGAFQGLYVRSTTATNGVILQGRDSTDATFFNILENPSAVPSGAKTGAGITVAQSGDSLSIYTPDNATANSTAVPSVFIEGGNKTAGTGDGGDINIRAGASAGGTGGGITLETAAGASGTTGGIYLNGNSRLGYSTYGGAAGTYSIGDNISTIVYTGANAVTLNLPTAVGRTGSIYTFVINGDTNQLTVGTSGTETIAGQSTVVLGEVGEGLIVQSDGTNWQLANRSNLYKTVSAHIETVGGTASVVAEHGNWISSITNTATGDYTVNITSGVFSNAPVPVVAAFDNSAYFAHIVVAPTTAAVRVRIANTSGTLVDGGTTTEGFMIMCHGY